MEQVCRMFSVGLRDDAGGFRGGPTTSAVGFLPAYFAVFSRRPT